MNINLHADLVRRSIDNYLIVRRRNRREEDVLENKFTLYQRQHHLIDHAIHMAQYRFEKYAENDLGFVITSKRIPFQSTKNCQLYYPIKDKNWSMKEYSVEPLYRSLQHQNSYEHIFARRSQQYAEELKEKIHLEKRRKESVMNKLQRVIDDPKPRKRNLWPWSEFLYKKFILLD